MVFDMGSAKAQGEIRKQLGKIVKSKAQSTLQSFLFLPQQQDLERRARYNAALDDLCFSRKNGAHGTGSVSRVGTADPEDRAEA